MGTHSPDQEVIKLLAKLKEADSEYPQHLLAARRQKYLRRMAEIELGIPRVEFKPATEPKIPPAPPAFNSTLLETILLVAIAVEVGALAYFNRDKLAELIQTITRAPEVGEIIAPPETMTVATPDATSTLVSLTVPLSPTEIVITSTQTPAPEALVVTITPSSSEGITQVAGTPVPNENNGNHYGQTPKPERTKENNGNGPPKDNDNKPPKDQPKPTKVK